MEKRKKIPTKSMENVFVHVKTNHDEFPNLFVVCVCEKIMHCNYDEIINIYTHSTLAGFL